MPFSGKVYDRHMQRMASEPGWADAPEGPWKFYAPIADIEQWRTVGPNNTVTVELPDGTERTAFVLQVSVPILEEARGGRVVAHHADVIEVQLRPFSVSA